MAKVKPKAGSMKRVAMWGKDPAVGNYFILDINNRESFFNYYIS